MILNKYYKVLQPGLVSVCFFILVAPLSWVWIGNFEFSGENWKISKSHNVSRDIISSSVLAMILLEIHFWGKWISFGPIGGWFLERKLIVLKSFNIWRKTQKIRSRFQPHRAVRMPGLQKKRSKMISNNKVSYKMWINGDSDDIVGFWNFSCLVQNMKFPIQKQSSYCWENIWYHVFLLLIK